MKRSLSYVTTHTVPKNWSYERGILTSVQCQATHSWVLQKGCSDKYVVLCCMLQTLTGHIRVGPPETSSLCVRTTLDTCCALPSCVLCSNALSSLLSVRVWPAPAGCTVTSLHHSIPPRLTANHPGISRQSVSLVHPCMGFGFICLFRGSFSVRQACVASYSYWPVSVFSKSAAYYSETWMTLL